MFKPVKITSSLIDNRLNNKLLEINLLNYLKLKIINLIKFNAIIDNNQLKYLLNKINYEFNLNNLNTIELNINYLIDQLNDNNENIKINDMKKKKDKKEKKNKKKKNYILKINKNEIIQILQPYLESSINLLNIILLEQEINKKNDIKRIDISCDYFSFIIINLFKDKLNNKLLDNNNIYYFNNNLQLLQNMAKLVN